MKAPFTVRGASSVKGSRRRFDGAASRPQFALRPCARADFVRCALPAPPEVGWEVLNRRALAISAGRLMLFCYAIYVVRLLRKWLDVLLVPPRLGVSRCPVKAT